MGSGLETVIGMLSVGLSVIADWADGGKGERPAEATPSLISIGESLVVILFRLIYNVIFKLACSVNYGIKIWF